MFELLNNDCLKYLFSFLKEDYSLIVIACTNQANFKFIIKYLPHIKMNNYLCLQEKDIAILEWFYGINKNKYNKETMIKKTIYSESLNAIINLYSNSKNCDDIFIYFAIKYNKLPIIKYIYNKSHYTNLENIYLSIRSNRVEILKWYAGVFGKKVINMNVIIYAYYRNNGISTWLIKNGYFDFRQYIDDAFKYKCPLAIRLLSSI